eukprot:4253621-Prymnesium_polylepis.1
MLTGRQWEVGQEGEGQASGRARGRAVVRQRTVWRAWRLGRTADPGSPSTSTSRLPVTRRRDCR